MIFDDTFLRNLDKLVKTSILDGQVKSFILEACNFSIISAYIRYVLMIEKL